MIQSVTDALHQFSERYQQAWSDKYHSLPKKYRVGWSGLSLRRQESGWGGLLESD